MSHFDNVIDIHRPVDFTIDGRPFSTRLRRQAAADLLLLAGRDPVDYDLGELRVHRPRPVRYENTDIVEVRRGSRFVSMKFQADVV